MNYIVAELAPGVYAAAIKDAGNWDTPTYTNFYVLRREEQVVLIDAGMKQYRHEIRDILKKIGIDANEVTHILLTHGHHDHADGAKEFSQASKYIHEQDINMLNPEMKSQFIKYSVVRDYVYSAPAVPDLDIVLVNSHSPGSVAIYDHASKALFAGDFFCFFGEPLPEGKLVSYGEQSRQESYQYVADQAAGGGGESQSFLQGLSRLLAYQPEFFCTGHGVVLQGDISEFLKELWKSGSAGKPL